MSAAHVRRGSAARAKAKKPAKVTVSKRFAKRLPMNQARANKLAGLAFGSFVLVIGAVVLIALDIPARAVITHQFFDERGPSIGRAADGQGQAEGDSA